MSGFDDHGDLRSLKNENKNKYKEVQLDEKTDFNIEPEYETNKEVITHISQVDTSAQPISIDLSKDKYNIFTSVLRMMKYSCQDIYIKGGRISQINSKKSMFFDIDLRPILGDIDLLIGSVSSKFELLSTFQRQNVDVILDVLPTGYVFRDSISKIHNNNPIESFMEQVYLTPEQRDSRLNIDYDRRIFKYTWDKKVLDRIISYTKTLGTPIIRIECLGSTIVCKMQSLDSAATTYVNLLTLEDEVDDTLIDNKMAPFPTMCWVNFIQGGMLEIESELYHRKDERASAVLKLSSEVIVPNVDDPITIKIYSAGYFRDLS